MSDDTYSVATLIYHRDSSQGWQYRWVVNGDTADTGELFVRFEATEDEARARALTLARELALSWRANLTGVPVHRGPDTFSEPRRTRKVTVQTKVVRHQVLEYGIEVPEDWPATQAELSPEQLDELLETLSYSEAFHTVDEWVETETVEKFL